MAEETKRDTEDVERWVKQRVAYFIEWLNSQDLATRVSIAISMENCMEQHQVQEQQ